MNRREVVTTLASFCAALRLDRFKPEERQAGTESKKNYALRNFVLPMYPTLARQKWIEGKVVAIADLSSEGRVVSVTIVSGHPLLQSPVSDSLKEWEFDAVADQTRQARIEFNFMLKGDRNERIVNYKVSGKLPEYFEIETNPVLMLHSSEN